MQIEKVDNMLDELYELVLGENGFLMELRCKNKFNEQMYLNIKEKLQDLVDEWKKMDFIPKYALLIIVELIDCMSSGNKFLNKEDAIKVEDGSLEIKDIVYCLYT